MVNHYTDDSDNPAWSTSQNPTGAPVTTVYTDQVASDLTMSIITDQAGTRGELALVTPRGDIASTITITAPTQQATGLDTWTRYTEYGHPTTAPPAAEGGVAGNGYGWLGAKQRTTTDIGILLMGARLYNPTTGLFTSLDPVHGGNDTPYTYPSDPINKQDISGEKGSWRKLTKGLKKFGNWYATSKFGKAASFACGFIRFSAVGAACTALDAVANVSRYGWKRGLAKTAINATGGRVIGKMSKKIYNSVRHRHGALMSRMGGAKSERMGLHRWGSKKNAAYRRTTKAALSAYRGGANSAVSGGSDRWASRSRWR